MLMSALESIDLVNNYFMQLKTDVYKIVHNYKKLKKNYKGTTYVNNDGQVCTYFPVNAESREISTDAKLFPICRGELTHPLYPEEYDSGSIVGSDHYGIVSLEQCT